MVVDPRLEKKIVLKKKIGIKKNLPSTVFFSFDPDTKTIVHIDSLDFLLYVKKIDVGQKNFFAAVADVVIFKINKFTFANLLNFFDKNFKEVLILKVFSNW